MVSQTVLFHRYGGFHPYITDHEMYHKISVLVPVLVRVPEYLSTSTSTSTLTLELTSTVRVPEIEYCEYEYQVRVPQPCAVATWTPSTLSPSENKGTLAGHGQRTHQLKCILSLFPPTAFVQTI